MVPTSLDGSGWSSRFRRLVLDEQIRDVVLYMIMDYVILAENRYTRLCR